MNEEFLHNTELKNISTRRNQIVHEGDYTATGIRQSIEKTDVDEVISFIEKLGDAIFNLAK